MHTIEGKLREYYDTVNLTVLVKKLNDDLIVKKYRSLDKYEFLYVCNDDKEMLCLSLTLVEPEKWLFHCDSHLMGGNKTRKIFREMICSTGCAKYINHSEEIPYKHIYAYDHELNEAKQV